MNTIRNIRYAAYTLAVLALLSGFVFLGVAQAQSSTITSTMDPGDSGAQVSALQSFLAADASIYPESLVTGYYGELTTTAVERYQCKNGIVCSGSVATTGYGRVGPATLAKIQTQLGTNPGGGVNLPPVGFPSGTDVHAPIVNEPVVTTTSHSATITWTASEAAVHRVMYSTTWPFLFSIAPSVASTGGYSQTATVTLTGLSPNTVYYFVPESVDAAGNLQWHFGDSFKTNS